MDKIIPSFSKSLFNSSKDIIGDIAEVGIDSILDDGIIKDIPVVGLLLGIKHTAQNLHDRNLLRQTIQFIKEFNEGTIDNRKLQQYKGNINSNPKKAEDELGRVLLYLNSTIELEKSKMYANIFRNYINENISWEEFCEFCEIVKILFISDLAYLNKIYSGKLKDTNNLPLYPFERLTSLGLIETTIMGLNISNNFNTRTDKYIGLSKIGGKFYQSIYKN